MSRAGAAVMLSSVLLARASIGYYSSNEHARVLHYGLVLDTVVLDCDAFRFADYA